MSKQSIPNTSFTKSCLGLLCASVLFVSAPASALELDLPISAPRAPSLDTDADLELPNEDDVARFYNEELPTTNESVIYVLDRSASMSISAEPYVGLDGNVVTTGTRLDFVKTEIKRSLRALPNDYTFNLVVYGECVDRWQTERQEATDENKHAAEAWLDSIVPWGWTNTGGAGQLALGDRDNQMVLLLSDGAPNFLDCAQTYVASFDTHRRVIRAANLQEATINTFGIGLDPETRAFLETVAQENHGVFREIGGN